MRWNEDNGCAGNHINGCPEKEWPKGVVWQSSYDGKIVHNRVFKTREDAQACTDRQVKWHAEAIERYKEIGVDPAPPQYYLWTYEILEAAKSD